MQNEIGPKIAYVYYPSPKGSGGYQIQKRNEEMLRRYSAPECFLAFQTDLYFRNKTRSGGPVILAKSALRLIKRKVTKYTKYLILYCRIKRFRPDMVFVDNSLIQFYGTDIFRKYNTVVFFHNVEGEYARQQYPDYAIDRNHAKLIRKIEANERKICKSASACICINERDSEALKKYYGREADLLLKSSIEDRFKPNHKKEKSEKYMLFVGSDFFGNTQGLFWFIENCMESVRYNLHVVGSGMGKYQGRYGKRNVSFEGYVENLEDYYINAECVVMPIISGSGMKTKTCEALMYGKIIIGTDEAFEGYSGIDETGCIRCNTKEEFVSVLNKCYESECKPFNRKIREYYLQNYTNDVIGNQFRLFMESI